LAAYQFYERRAKSHSQRSIQCRRKSLSHDVTKIDSDHAVRQREKIQEIAAHFMKGLELIAGYVSGSQRAPRQHAPLNRARFRQLQLALRFQIVQQRSVCHRHHELCEREFSHRRGSGSAAV
jgi:hypothetical protein